MIHESVATTVTFIHNLPGDNDEPQRALGQDDVVLDPDKELTEAVEEPEEGGQEESGDASAD